MATLNSLLSTCALNSGACSPSNQIFSVSTGAQKGIAPTTISTGGFTTNLNDFKLCDRGCLPAISKIVTGNTQDVPTDRADCRYIFEL